MPDKIKVSGDFFTTEDGFGYDKYANTIIKMITDDDFPSPFTFGIFGEWGSGKTSLMRMIEDRLRKDSYEMFIPVWFNPWRYEKEEHLIIPFLKTIQHSIEIHLAALDEKLSPKAKKKLRELKNRLSKIAFALAASLKGELNFKILKLEADLSKAIQAGEKIEEKEKEKEDAEELKQYASIYYDVIRYLGDIAEQEPKNLKIVVFIDDLDRCLPEKAIEVFEGIKTFLDIPGYVFFVGVDRSVIEKGVKVKYKGFVIDDKREGKSEAGKDDQTFAAEIPITPVDYLEKIIQMPIPLPPVDKSRVKGYLKQLLQKNESIEKYLDIIQLGLKQNPRTYKRFINTLAFHTKLAVEKGCLKTSDDMIIKEPFMTLELLIKWTILNFAFLDLMEAMKARKLLVVELQEWIERLDSERQDMDIKRESREQTGITEAPSYLRQWVRDDKLKAILRINGERGDSGFTKDNIDLYMQMGEFTYATLSKAINAEPIVISVRDEIGKMVKIPAGVFLYGDNKEKKTLSAYEIGIYPVTNEEYKEFISSMPDCKMPVHWDQEEKLFPKDKGKHPVVNISFKDAVQYCKWKNDQEDKYEYRLPSEMEWERAARGTDGREYPWGDEYDKDKCNTDESNIGDTTPVDSYASGVSPNGCYDMAGNVWEWTSSDFNDESKVIRGGSWSDNLDIARCAFRNWILPDYWNLYVGFRCARTLKT